MVTHNFKTSNHEKVFTIKSFTLGGYPSDFFMFNCNWFNRFFIVRMKSDLFNFYCVYYNVHPVTFKRIRATSIVTAYDFEHAKRVLDRHPSLIIKVIKLSKSSQHEFNQ